MTDKGDDILELKQYDRGHLVALELSGVDDRHLIVPMNREFNQSGYWRKMETAIGDLMAGVNQVAIDGTPVLASGSGSPATFSLRVKNVIDLYWRIEVRMYYDDVVGDSRIPVWFYTRLFHGTNLVAHFSHANRCGLAELMPSREEVLEFMAARDLYPMVRASGTLNVNVSPFHGEYVNLSQKVPPNQLMQFMHDVNGFSIFTNGAKVFTTFDQVTIGPSTAYKTFQRKVFKKFNRWKNNSFLKSDVPENDLYDGEEKDRYQDLSECGGRNAPEIDHIGPSYQSGMNSYINGRLVSFYHNHIYREKKVTGSLPLSQTLWDRFQRDALLFADPAGQTLTRNGVQPPPKRVKRKSLTFARAEDDMASWGGRGMIVPTRDLILTINVKDVAVVNAQTFLNTYFSDDALYVNDAMPADHWPYKGDLLRAEIEARRKFVLTERQRARKLTTEKSLERKYVATAQSFRAGLDDFINTLGNPGRVDLLARIAAAGIPLCTPSDELTNAGIGNLQVGTAFPQITAAQAVQEWLYQDVFSKARGLGLIT